MDTKRIQATTQSASSLLPSQGTPSSSGGGKECLPVACPVARSASTLAQELVSSSMVNSSNTNGIGHIAQQIAQASQPLPLGTHA